MHNIVSIRGTKFPCSSVTCHSHKHGDGELEIATCLMETLKKQRNEKLKQLLTAKVMNVQTFIEMTFFLFKCKMGNLEKKRLILNAQCCRGDSAL